MSANIKPEAYSTFKLVATFINLFTKISVNIAAYTACVSKMDLFLSRQQAQQVSKVLQASGVDARLIYAEGYGGTNLVTQNQRDWDGSDNYRIEISLENLYV